MVIFAYGQSYGSFLMADGRLMAVQPTIRLDPISV